MKPPETPLPKQTHRVPVETAEPAATCQDETMARILSTWLVSTLALAFAALVLGERMRIGDPNDELTDRLLTLALVGIIFTLINLVIAPAVKLISLPFIVLTLGLLLLVINALLLLLTQWMASQFNIDFFVDGFWWAVLASIVVSLAQSILAAVLRQDR